MKTAVILSLLMAPIALPQNGATVDGLIRNSATRAGVEGAEVHLWTKDGVHYETTTDAGGAFRIAGMKDGEYNMRLEKPGFTDPGAHDPDWHTVRVSAARESNRVEVEMAPWGSIRGRVLDSEGHPAAGIEVEVTLANHATTDEEGKFTITGLAPGKYTLRATPKTAPAPRSAGAERIEVLPTYFPSVLDRREAQAAQISAGAELAGYDIRLRAAPAYRVRGVVLDAAGKPAVKARVTLRSGEAALGSIGIATMPGGIRRYLIGTDTPPGLPSETVTGEDGSFEFPSVRAGDWRVRAELSLGWNSARRNDDTLMASTPVVVERQDVDDLQIRLEAPVALDAAIEWSDDPPAATHPRVSLTLSGVDGQFPVMLTSGPDGKFTTGQSVFPGHYRMDGGTVASGYYPVSIRLGGQEVLGQVVDLRSGSPPLSVTYKTATGKVMGTIDQGEGATVVLWRPVQGEWQVVTTPPAGPNGAFAIDMLQPGEYSAAAFRNRPPLRIEDAAVLRVLAGSASRIRVEDGATASVRLAVSPWPE